MTLIRVTIQIITILAITTQPTIIDELMKEKLRTQLHLRYVMNFAALAHNKYSGKDDLIIKAKVYIFVKFSTSMCRK